MSQGLIPGMGKGRSLFFMATRPALEFTQPVVTQGLFPQVQWLGCEANYSPPSRTEAKNTWIYTSNTSYITMARCLINEVQGQLC
jgi:hypothetical protein